MHVPALATTPTRRSTRGDRSPWPFGLTALLWRGLWLDRRKQPPEWSLKVWPVAGLPLESGAYAIVNRGPTALDQHAAVTIDATAGETLAALVEAL